MVRGGGELLEPSRSAKDLKNGSYEEPGRQLGAWRAERAEQRKAWWIRAWVAPCVNCRGSRDGNAGRLRCDVVGWGWSMERARRGGKRVVVADCAAAVAVWLSGGGAARGASGLDPGRGRRGGQEGV